MELRSDWAIELIYEYRFLPLAHGQRKELVEKNWSDEEVVLDFIDSQDIDNIVTIYCKYDQVLIPSRFEVSTNEEIRFTDLYRVKEMDNAIEKIEAYRQALEETRERFMPFAKKWNLDERKA